jgi:hypothetical protein
MESVRTVRRLGAVLGVFAAVCLALPALAAGAVPRVTSVAIDATMPVIDQTLRAYATATGQPTPTLTFEWLRCTGDLQPPCTPIGTATSISYTATAADGGRSLAVRATASNASGSSSAVSSMTAAVTAPADVKAVTITGSAVVVGQPLSAEVDVSGYPPPVVAYQWQRCEGGAQPPCTPIGAATAATYVPTGDDAGKRLSVLVTAGGDQQYAPLTDPVQEPPSVTSLRIIGSAVVGRTLTAAAGVRGEPAPVVTYQWLGCDALLPAACKPLDGETRRSYDVSTRDVGRRLAVRVTAVNLRGEATSPSSPTELVPDPPTHGSDFDQAGRFRLTSHYIPLRYLRPFPVVRVKGALVSGGARVTLWRVTAPRGSRVVVRCKRFGCPVRRRAMDVGRIRILERFLPAGARIVIRVTKPGLIGKYAQITIRDGKAPKRRDACVLPGSAEPTECPAP